MAITGYELVTVQGEYVTADLLCWRRYKVPCYGILEEMLDANPHLSLLHVTSPFLPIGTQVRLPIDPEILAGRPSALSVTTVYRRI